MLGQSKLFDTKNFRNTISQRTPQLASKKNHFNYLLNNEITNSKQTKVYTLQC